MGGVHERSKAIGHRALRRPARRLIVSLAVKIRTGVRSPRLRSVVRTSSPPAPGQHEIKHDEIEQLVVHKEKALFAGGRDADLVVLCLEPVTQGLRNLRFVFDTQDPHGTRKYSRHLRPTHLT
jgi:hypothetical protein